MCLPKQPPPTTPTIPSFIPPVIGEVEGIPEGAGGGLWRGGGGGGEKGGEKGEEEEEEVVVDFSFFYDCSCKRENYDFLVVDVEGNGGECEEKNEFKCGDRQKIINNQGEKTEEKREEKEEEKRECGIGCSIKTERGKCKNIRVHFPRGLERGGMEVWGGERGRERRCGGGCVVGASC